MQLVGDVLACSFRHWDGTKPYYQGQSAENDEMCLFSGLYYPSMGIASDFCAEDTDMLGTGSTSCQDTQTCTQKCGLAGSPADISLENTDVDPCWQTCLAQSCPSAWRPWMAQASCARSQCKTECATPGSGACTACASAKCGPEIDACNAATCL